MKLEERSLFESISIYEKMYGDWKMKVNLGIDKT